jgi:hypothetical protein
MTTWKTKREMSSGRTMAEFTEILIREKEEVIGVRISRGEQDVE